MVRTFAGPSQFTWGTYVEDLRPRQRSESLSGGRCATFFARASRWLTTGLVVLGVVAAGTVSSPTAFESTVSTNLLHSTMTVTGTATSIVRLPETLMDQGQERYLSANYSITNTNTFAVLQGAQIWCTLSGGATSKSVNTTRNATSLANSSATAHWMFAVPADGYYSCELVGHSVSDGKYKDGSGPAIHGDQ